MSSVTTSETAGGLVHVAAIRKVRKGREAEFESRISDFFAAAAEHSGVEGAYLLRPLKGSNSSEYGILRSFRSAQDMRQFYQSELYRRWNEAIAPLVEGEPQVRELHGLEAFFRSPAPPPPRWKMAVLTWLGVYPAVYFSSWLVAAAFGQLPRPVGVLLVTLLVVPLLAWVLMPLLTKIFRAWLHPHQQG